MTNEPNPKKENPAKKSPGQPPLGKTPAPKTKGPFSWLIMGLIILAVLMMFQKVNQVKEISYNKFNQMLIDKDIKSVVIHPSKIVGTLKEDRVEKVGKGKASFQVNYIPATTNDDLRDRLVAAEVETIGEAPDFWGPFLMSVFPLVILVGIIYFVFMRNMRGGGGMLMNFGRSKHRVQGKDSKITFADVAGIEEAKAEVAETIEFLKNPKKFQKIGGRIPRGVLLVGPPGCGKTLLAKAIAGESDVPFFTISGSDFVEMFVGVGASRVRDLFKQAKENSPCIIFLDEVDAIGRKRGMGMASGGHDEREQTLNAILVEMDGFDTNDQVIVMAATNRGDILDQALTRPGRFDRQVIVPLPDLNGRVQILGIHAKKIKMSEGIDFEKLARQTPMFSGAELEALINEAAISASMAAKDCVEMSDLEEARDKVRWGRAKKSRVVDEQDRKMTAYHEAGHALIQYLLKEADPLHKVSIIPRGPYGGATFALPEKDRMYYSKKYCIAQMQVCFGGRIAEEMFFDDITSGASSDLRQATTMAKEMILSWGMGKELGPVSYATDVGGEMYFPSSTPDYSEKTSQVIDEEIKQLVSGAYQSATELIDANKERLDELAQSLLKYETLDVEDVKIVLEGGMLDKPTVADLLAAEQSKSEAEDSQDDSIADDMFDNPYDDPIEGEPKEDDSQEDAQQEDTEG
ncbi:MAG: ATP-dependent zinc metalloprotease FtsH [Planctomycetes bacterium]|nr:ATP-dependent zinc metalloprotease FtsH [Planctomycetota bacterium]